MSQEGLIGEKYLLYQEKKTIIVAKKVVIINKCSAYRIVSFSSIRGKSTKLLYGNVKQKDRKDRNAKVAIMELKISPCFIFVSV